MNSNALRTSLAIFVLTAAGGCDSAERQSEQGTVLAAPVGESVEFETCATTSDCMGSLRCVDSTCVSTARSRLGDFHAARGRRALAQGELEAAAAAYNDAITTYEKESVTPPIRLLCEQGVALAQAREDAKLAEAGARILHKCILSVPPTSVVARSAMDALASLGEVGLDGDLLSRSEPADLYLTGEATGPDLTKLTVQVSSDGKSTKSSFNAFVDALRSEENEAGFQSCWQESWKTHKREQLDVTIEVTYRFHLDPDDESRDRAEIKVSEISGLSGAEADASKCVHAIASEAGNAVAGTIRQDTRWKSKVRIQVGEGG